MSNLLSRFLRTAIATALAFGALSVSAQTTLRYSDHEPLGNMRTRFIHDQFFAEVEKQSQGRIKIQPHWQSEIATGYDALKAVGQENKAELAMVVPEYSRDALPLHQLFKSFPTGPAGDKQVAFLREGIAACPN